MSFTPDPTNPFSSQPIAIEEQFRIMADTAPVLIWISGTDKLCYFFNTGWLNFRGRTMEQEYGNGWTEGVHSDDLERCLKIYVESFDQCLPFKMEYRLKRHDGVYRWILDNGIPRYTPDGIFAGYIGSCIDIEEMKQAQGVMQQMNYELEARVAQRTMELQQSNAALQRSNQELEQFAYAASHDMKEPIRKISIYGEYILEDPLGAEKYVRKIQDAATRMNNLIDNLLDLSSMKKEANAFAPVDLNTVLHEVLVDLELLINQKHATIKADPLPALTAIPQQMHQLFYNLLSNALKYASKDESPFITIRSDQRAHNQEPDRPDGYEITFADNGIGFEQKDAEKIFTIFQRLHARSEYPGTGVGLALCKKVVQNHGGSISATSMPGQGATFRIWLPAQQPG